MSDEAGKPPDIRVKRAYAPAAAGDGRRVLVDRVWPRGRSKESLQLHAWMKEAAPSSALRKWFNHAPERWEAFQARYFGELDARPEVVRALRALAAEGRLTLVFAAREERYNNAVALKSYLQRQADG